MSTMNLTLLAIINHTAHHLECECKGEGIVGGNGCYHGSRCDCNDGVEVLCSCTYEDRIQGVVLCACCGELSAEAVDEHGTPYCQRCGDEFDAAELEELDRQATEAMDRFLAGGPGGFVWEDEE